MTLGEEGGSPGQKLEIGGRDDLAQNLLQFLRFLERRWEKTKENLANGFKFRSLKIKGKGAKGGAEETERRRSNFQEPTP